jgi:hypothetical protein
VLAGALIPLPVAASESGPVHTTTTAPKAVSLHQAVAQAAVRAAAEAPLAPKPASLAPASKPQRRADQSSGNGVTSFFKSRPGIIALSVMAAGTGYAIYSANHDRIVSAGRK